MIIRWLPKGLLLPSSHGTGRLALAEKNIKENRQQKTNKKENNRKEKEREKNRTNKKNVLYGELSAVGSASVGIHTDLCSTWLLDVPSRVHNAALQDSYTSHSYKTLIGVL